MPTEGDRSAQPLTDADVEALGKRTLAPDIASVTPVVTGSALLQQQGQPGYRTGITGTTANYADVTDLELVTGTFFDEQQERTKAKVVILGTAAGHRAVRRRRRCARSASGSGSAARRSG